MARHKDAEWNLPQQSPSYDCAQLGVLMDLRDELKEIKRSQMLQCDVAQAIKDLAKNIRGLRRDLKAKQK